MTERFQRLRQIWGRLTGLETPAAPDPGARERFDREFDALLAEMARTAPQGPISVPVAKIRAYPHERRVRERRAS